MIGAAYACAHQQNDQNYGVIYIILKFLDKTREDKGFWNDW
jgi:hypothetical protein